MQTDRPTADMCYGERGKVRAYRPDGSRYIACAACGADVTDSGDIFAERTGGHLQPHEKPNAPRDV